MSDTLRTLAAKSCKACHGAVQALDEAQIVALIAQLPNWQRTAGEISKTLKFKNYYETIAFVNASAWISHQEDHHPDLEVGYNQVAHSLQHPFGRRIITK